MGDEWYYYRHSNISWQNTSTCCLTAAPPRRFTTANGCSFDDDDDNDDDSGDPITIAISMATKVASTRNPCTRIMIALFFLLPMLWVCRHSTHIVSCNDDVILNAPFLLLEECSLDNEIEVYSYLWALPRKRGQKLVSKPMPDGEIVVVVVPVRNIIYVQCRQMCKQCSAFLGTCIACKGTPFSMESSGWVSLIDGVIVISTFSSSSQKVHAVSVCVVEVGWTRWWTQSEKK